MQGKIKVLQVVEACEAGVGRHVRGLCEDLNAQGHDVAVAYAPYRVDAAFRRFMMDYRSEIDFVPLRLRRQISPARDLAGLIHLLRFVKREGPFDVIHGHSSKGGAIGRLAGLWSRVPTVYTPHSLIMSSPDNPRLKSSAYTAVEYVLGNLATSAMIAVSADEREFINRLKLTSKRRVAIINNGIDDRVFALSDTRWNRNPKGQKPLTFGSIMRFSPQKAPGHLVEAFAQLVSMLPRTPVRLILAGDGELFAEVKRQVQASGLNAKISLLGWTTDTRAVLHECDVFVLSSLYEGFSYAILEAMVERLPIVSTDVYGTRETVAAVAGNVLVPAGQPSALAHGMRRMIKDDASSSRRVLEEIGRANYNHVRAHFRQSETTRRTLEIYRGLSWRAGITSEHVGDRATCQRVRSMYERIVR
jgi:glycosyltransferase involved in cell wall biosynthesis